MDNTVKFGLNQFSKADLTLYSLLLITFFMVSAIGIVNHEMWRDELEAWLIARDSNSLADLLDNLKYIGHPSLWYLCLYFLAKLTYNPLIMQLLHLIIATVVVFVFLYYSSLSNLQKTLFCFSYFPLYEYGIISRNYSLGVLLIFTCCSLLGREKNNYLFVAIVLALLCHVNAYSLIIGFVFALVLFTEALIKIFWFNRESIRKSNLIISITIYLCGLLTAMMQIIPPNYLSNQPELVGAVNQANQPDKSSFATTIIENSLTADLGIDKVVTGIWRSYIPIPDFFNQHLWGTNILTDSQQLPRIASINSAPIIATFLSLLLFLIFAAIFVRQPKVFLIYTGGTLLITLFGLVATMPALRHNGHLFILLIACYWIFLDNSRANFLALNQYYYNFIQHSIFRFLNKYKSILLTSILFIQFYAGVKIYTLDLIKPFSNSQDAAIFIQQNKLADYIIIGSPDLKVSPISAWLNRPIYYPEVEDFGTFTVWIPKSTKHNTDITQQEIIEQVEQLSKKSSKLLLLLDRKLFTTNSELSFDLIGSFDNSSLVEEDFFLYSIN
ncbi:MAG: hypothetical protein ACFCU7_18760 [Pleurocapsa sp.]